MGHRAERSLGSCLIQILEIPGDQGGLFSNGRPGGGSIGRSSRSSNGSESQYLAGGRNGANAITIGRSWNGSQGTTGAGWNGTQDFDDLYIADDNPAGAHDFLGNLNVNTLMPNGAGAVTQFSPTGAAANWQAVDEIPPNDDTSYVGSSTAGNQDLYTVPAPPVTAGSVPAVAVNMWARTDDGGAHQVEPLVRTGSTTAAGPALGINSGYTDAQSIMESNPANGNAAFTLGEIATDQFGVQYAS
jgi:hypothetical protein